MQQNIIILIGVKGYFDNVIDLIYSILNSHDLASNSYVLFDIEARL